MKTFTPDQQAFLDKATRDIEHAVLLVEARTIGSNLGDPVRREILNLLNYYQWSVKSGSTPLATAQAALEFINTLNPAPEKAPRYNGHNRTEG